MNKTQFLIPGSLYPNMTAQKEQQVAQQFVEDYKLAKGERFTDDPTDMQVVTELDLLAMAKHLANIGKLAVDMLTNDALRQVYDLIYNENLDDNGETIQVAKQFVFNGNKWLYQIKETYDQLGNQRKADGTLDPNSQTYRTLEADYEQTKSHMKALTQQMNGLQARILDDHNLQPTDVSVNLLLRGVK